jgi:L-galactose dehydrogenase/L-glyceraldehyde 3-phosphate reductase
MHYREFGTTGLIASELGFGCGRVGGLLIDGSDADRRLAIRLALDGGINWFDTAEAYGDGKSEEALGWLLEERGAEPYISTKITVDPTAADLAGQIEEHGARCLARLRRKNVTVLQLHNRIEPKAGARALSVEQVLGPGGVVDGLERMRAAGRAQFIGFSGLGDRDAILAVIESGRLHAMQVYYNLVNPSAARAMPPQWSGQNLNGIMAAAQRHGMGTLGIRVLDGGIIATDDRAKPVSMMVKQTDEPAEMRKAQATLDALGAGLGSRPQVGLRFALSCPQLTTALVGIGRPEHVTEALAAAAMGPLPADALSRLEPLYARDFGAVR